MPVIEGAGLGTPLTNAGAPSAGTDEIQTITIGGTPTAGTFTLTFEGQTTAAITWSAVNATLVAAIDAALEALNTIGTGGVTTAVGTATAGIGTFTVTFTGNNAKRAVGLMTSTSSLTGSSPTLAVTETTPGVDATARGIAKGGLVIDVSNGKLYIATTGGLSPVFAVVGTQT
jgi:hypothetical protein